jgi:mannonate dehydratase
MTRADPPRQIGEVIRYFDLRGRIFAVHFRNIRGRRGDFQEVFPDEGDVDMLAALRAYKESVCAGMPCACRSPADPRRPSRF